MSTTYRIGEFAELAGVSRKTLRFYDEIGLLRPALTDPRTRYRSYQPRQLRQVAAILALKDLGLSLGDIQNALGSASPKRDSHRETLEHLRSAIKLSMEEAGCKLAYVEAALCQMSEGKSPPPVCVKRIAAIPVASVRSRVECYEAIEPLERELLAELPAHAVGALRGVLWHRCADSGSLEGEAFVELRAKLPRRSVYDLSELPSVTAACAYPGTDNEEAELAYAAIKAWMKQRGHQLAAPKREIYRGDILEIQFPVQVA